MRRLAGLTRGADGGSLEAVLDAHLDKVFAVARELDELAVRTAVLEAAQRRTVPARRPRPLQPVRGDRRQPELRARAARRGGDGWVLSSLHARSGTRVYAKAIKAGRADGRPVGRGDRGAPAGDGLTA